MEHEDVLAERDAGHPLVELLRRHGRPHAWTFAVGLLALLVARIPQRIPALMIGVALDALLFASHAYSLPLVPDAWLPSTTWGLLWFTVGVLAAAVVAESALDWVSHYVYNRGTLATLHDVRTATYDAVMGLEMGYFDDHQSGEVMSVLNNDVTNLRDLFDGGYQGVSFVAQIVVAYLFMALLHWQLALVMAVLPLGLAVTSRYYARWLEPRYDRVRESVGTVNSRLEDAINGVATVKAYAREDHERERIAAASGEYRDSRWSAIRLRIVYDAATWLTGRMGERALLLLGGYWILAGPPLFFTQPLTAGALLTFLMYSRSFLHPVRRLAVEVIDRYENALASGKRVLAIHVHPARLDEGGASGDGGADEGEREDVPDLVVEEGAVAYEDVTFTYDGADEPSLDDVDVRIEPGEFVGVVGSTGAGKSTLVKLLFRFYDPDEGRITIDGQDVSLVDVRSLRAHVGYVSQDPFLFYGTVRENVAYGRPDASDEAIEAAATLAGAHEFVRELPEGYDTEVGERGVQLSGGQRQRIAIARALLRDPEILVLDEATSHVDNETELLIKRSLDSLAADRTTFAIAHRLSTVRNADRILVMDEGRLVEQGTHDELLSADGVYADLWRVQVGDVAAVSESFVRRAVDGGGGRPSGDLGDRR